MRWMAAPHSRWVSSIRRTEVNKWGFDLTWQGRSRAKSIGVRSSEQAETTRTYVGSRTEREYHSLLALSGREKISFKTRPHG